MSYDIVKFCELQIYFIYILFVILVSVEMGFKQLLENNEDLHKKILCYEPIWIEELKEDLKQQNVNISMQKLMTFLDDKVKYLLGF